jgi:glycosyltransferase involved in cell wall biosynthesis
VPNKCIQDIIKAFYYYHTWITPESRLLLVGSDAEMGAYAVDLRRLTHRLGLGEAVVFAGPYGAADGLAAFYRQADVYVSMSEHEGYCVPVVEAMYYGIPVMAYASTGVPYTMGEAGVMLLEKEYPVVAEMAHELITNDGLRKQLLAGQRRRLEALSPEMARTQFQACLDVAIRE